MPGPLTESRPCPGGQQPAPKEGTLSRTAGLSVKYNDERPMDYRVEILRFTTDADTVVARLEWKYRTLSEAQEAGRREVEVTAEATSANGYRVIDEEGRQASVWKVAD